MLFTGTFGAKQLEWCSVTVPQLPNTIYSFWKSLRVFQLILAYSSLKELFQWWTAYGCLWPMNGLVTVKARVSSLSVRAVSDS